MGRGVTASGSVSLCARSAVLRGTLRCRTDFFTYLPTYLFSCLPACSSAYVPTSLPACLSSCLPIHPFYYWWRIGRSAENEGSRGDEEDELLFWGMMEMRMYCGWGLGGRKRRQKLSVRCTAGRQTPDLPFKFFFSLHMASDLVSDNILSLFHPRESPYLGRCGRHVDRRLDYSTALRR